MLAAKEPLVVLVEDDADISFALGVFLEEEGVRVFAADQATRGYELISEHHPQVVVTDLYMPEVDGLEFLGMLQAHPLRGDFSVIAYSADSTMRAAALAVGADVFMTKPFKPAALISTIRQFTDSPPH